MTLPELTTDEPLRVRARRRAITVSAIFLAAALLVVLSPVLLPAAALVDVLRRLRGGPAVALRLCGMAGGYLLGEVLGILWLSALWLRSLLLPPAERRAYLIPGAARVQRLWTSNLLRGAAALFRLRFTVDWVGGEPHVTRGPAVLFIRHTSLLDTLLPSTLLSVRHGLRLRFVLKRELLVDPCLDIAGHFLPNHFVRRDGSRSQDEIARVRALASGIAADDWGLIYPEGTRHTPRKRERALERLRQTDPALAERAARLRHILPPQLGGPLALLDGAPEADVVLFAHRGLEPAGAVGDLWSGKLLNQTIAMRLWRVPRADIPPAGPERVAWLYQVWQELDDWLVSPTPTSDTPGLPNLRSRDV